MPTPASGGSASAGADRIAAAFLLLFAALVIIESRRLPYWTANAPGPGFLPFWLGVMLGCGGAVILARTFARRAPHSWAPDRPALFRVAVVVSLTAGAAALATIVGLVLASAVFMGATLAYLRPDHTRANWIATLLTPMVVWLLFVRWLAVPLPRGPLGF